MLLALLAVPVMAQRSSRSGIGLKVGAQLANTRSAAFTYEPITGAVLGGYMPIWVANRFEVQPELLFSMQGSAFTPSEGNRQATYLFYAQVPLSAKLYVSNALNLQTGIQAGWMVTALQDGNPVKERYKPMDIGFNMGLGLDLIGGTDLTVRYYSGMTPVLMNDGLIYPTNRTLQLTAGYRMVRFKHHVRRRR
jgi:hypothetical protein